MRSRAIELLGYYPHVIERKSRQGEVVAREDCESLRAVLQLYDAIGWRALTTALRVLTALAAACVVISIVILPLSRRLLRHGIVVALLVAQLAVLIPYFVLDARRSAMELNRIHVNGEIRLFSLVKECKDIYNIDMRSLARRSDFQYQSQHVTMQALASTLCACLCGILGSHLLYIAIARATGLDDRFASRMEPQPARRSTLQVDELLTTVRVADSNRTVDREEHCAICLDPMKDSGDLSMLTCAHVFHEQCMGDWLRCARSPSTCPMCKACVWQDDESSDNNVIPQIPDISSSTSASDNDSGERRNEGNVETRDEIV